MIFFGFLTGTTLLANPGTVVSLAWDASTDSSVSGYHVYYGTASRVYTNVVPVGSSTSVLVSNLASGVTYYFAATTYTSAGLESDYSAEASYSVPAPNTPPTLDPIANLTIPHDSSDHLVQLSGITSGSSSEPQNLSVSAFSSNPGLIPTPVVEYASPGTVGTLILSTTPGSFGSSIVTVLVDDGGSVSNTVIRSFTVTVTPPDSPPTIDSVTNVVVTENSGTHTVALSGITSGSTNSNEFISITAVSSNPGLVPNPTINYVSPASTGMLSFAPASNGVGSATITVAVSNSQPTNNTTAISFDVAVNATPLPPGVITNITISPNTTLRFLINPPATNGDKFNFSLAAGAPVGAKITTRKGFSWLVWTPTMSQASTTNSIGIKVTDVSNSSLSTNETVMVVVQDYLSLVVGSTSIQAGQSGSVPISVASSGGLTNLTFTIPWSGSQLSSPSLSVSAGAISTSSLKVQTNSLVINLQTSARQPLEGSNIVASLQFQSVGSQASSYVALPVSSISALDPTGASYVNAVPTSGQVAVINNLAMLQVTSSPTRSLTVLGKTGVQYEIQYCTNFGRTATWYPLLTYSQTNVSQNISLSSTAPNIFYRVQQK